MRWPLFALLSCLPTLALAEEARWRRPVGPDAGATFLAVVEGVVVVATWNSQLVGLDAASGKELWRHKHPEVAGTTLLAAVAGGQVVAGVPERPELLGRTPRSGKEVWRRPVEGGVVSLQACPGHRLVAATHRGRGANGQTTLLLHALDPVDGRTLWQVPTQGELVGSAPGWLITATPEGTGRLVASLTAYRCTDGAATPLPRPERRFSDLLAADEKRVISRHFEFGFTNAILCSTELATQAQACFSSAMGGVPDYGVSGALLRGDELFFATAHPTAHNLDPSADGWVFRYDLNKGALLMRSEPFLSSGLFADAGDQIVTAFGTTGVEDFGHILDLNGEKLASVKLKKAPRQVAADAERAYFATYDGEVLALDLPRPGLKPQPEALVAAQALPEPPRGPDLGWKLLKSFAAHPAKAATSGSMGEGFIYDLDWLDADTLLVGGNDDKAGVWSAEGNRLWLSPGLGKDVQRVGACDGGFAVQTYGGLVASFRGAGKKFKPARRAEAGFGWAFGVTATCDVLADDFDGNFQLFDGNSLKAKGNFSAPGVFDRRGVHIEGSGVVVSSDGVLESRNLAGDLAQAVTTWPTPTQAHGGALSQAWLLADGRLLREYVGNEQAVVEILPAAGGAPEKTLTFDVTGHGWSPTVPSVIAVSPDGGTLVFFRRQLDLLLVDVATDRRQPLVDLAGPQSGLLEAAFSPDGRRLAIAGHPRGHEVTVLERSK